MDCRLTIFYDIVVLFLCNQIPIKCIAREFKVLSLLITYSVKIVYCEWCFAVYNICLLLFSQTVESTIYDDFWKVNARHNAPLTFGFSNVLRNNIEHNFSWILILTFSLKEMPIIYWCITKIQKLKFINKQIHKTFLVFPESCDINKLWRSFWHMTSLVFIHCILFIN